jgi:hypothetical protein
MSSPAKLARRSGFRSRSAPDAQRSIRFGRVAGQIRTMNKSIGAGDLIILIVIAIIVLALFLYQAPNQKQIPDTSGFMSNPVWST